MTQREAGAAIRAAARPLSGASDDYDALLDAIGGARLVLIGEASHGTHEFYRERARLTRRLIEEKGFNMLAVEADWPDAYRVNRSVRGRGADPDALAALDDFQRFPQWMWRNRDVLDFVAWLRGHNERQPGAQVGFYGLDLYSLHRSMEAVVRYLEGVDPEAARRAQARYRCFEPYGEDPQHYGLATGYGLEEPCEDAVVAQLVELQRRQAELGGGSEEAADAHFFAEQNARLALSAERYYRSMFRGEGDSWNLRDTHMADTVDALLEHAESQGQRAKIVLWAHNSHLGDARATEAGWRHGELNVGQLLRQRHGPQSFLIGQSTYAGTVTAAGGWGGAAEVKRVRPGLPGSLEALCHDGGLPAFWLDLREAGDAIQALRAELLQRFIGVIYRPGSERQSHYLFSRPADQYDALLYFDRTSALTPLDGTDELEPDELPDTFPSGT